MRIERSAKRDPSGSPPFREIDCRELQVSEKRACEEFFRHLDPQDIQTRFGSARISVEPMCCEPPGRHAFAAFDVSREILGVSHLAYLSSGSAEIAIVVRSDCKRRGVGRSLLAYVILWAEHRGLSEIISYVDANNHAALALASAMGFQGAQWDLYLCELTLSVAAGK
jgi:acetyltransferase